MIRCRNNAADLSRGVCPVCTCVPRHKKTKAAYVPNHVFIGIFTYFGAAFTAIIGIQDKNSALGCSYDFTLTEPDYNPAAHYWDIYAGCRLSNGLGVCPRCTCIAMYTVPVLVRFRWSMRLCVGMNGREFRHGDRTYRSK